MRKRATHMCTERVLAIHRKRVGDPPLVSLLNSEQHEKRGHIGHSPASITLLWSPYLTLITRLKSFVISNTNTELKNCWQLKYQLL